MLKTLALAAAGVVALGGAAAAQDMKPTHDFLMKAGASDKFEITEAKLASTRAHSPAVKKFASKMIQDHTKSTMMLKRAAVADMGHPPPPPMLMPEQEKMVADLRGARGRDFDRMYVDQQVQAHQMALDTMQDYANNGPHAHIKTAAAKIVPVVQMHLDHIKHIQSDMH